MRYLIIILLSLQALFVQAEINKDMVNAYACQVNGDYSSAIDKFTVLLKDNTSTIKADLYFSRAQCYYATGDYLKAKGELQRLINDSHAGANLLMAKTSLRLNNTNDVYFYLERYLNLDTLADVSQIKYDTCFKTLYQTDKWFDFWQDKNDSELQEFTKDIRYLIKKNNYPEALSLIKTKEESPYVNYLQSVVYFESGDVPNAFAYINKAIASNSGNTDFLEKKALYLRYLSKYAEECLLREQIAIAEPSDFSNYYKLAECYYYNEDNLQANEYISLLLNYFPDNLEYNFLSTKILLQDNNFMEALKTINKVLKSTKEDSEALQLRGIAYLKMGTYSQAAADFSMSLDLVPANAEAYYYLGECNFKLGKTKAACYNWGKAAELGSVEAIKEIIEYCQE